MNRPGALAGIGKTPIVTVSRLAPSNGARVWVKLEAANPTGSYKDRMALAMIEAAERRGDLHPGQTVVEYSGGSTGSSLAFVCAIKGYLLRIVTSNAFAPAKLRTMEAFGARLDVIDSPDGIHPGLIPAMVKRVADIVALEGGYATDQFNNRDALNGYRDIGEEIVTQIDAPVAAFCAYVGVGGCFLGVSEVLSLHNPGMTRVAVEPAESAVLSGGTPGAHRIEGGGVGFVPPLLADGGFDHVEAVSTGDACAMAQRAAVTEGLWSGPSFGANLTAALRLAAALDPSHVVVTIQPDSGLKYLDGDLYA
jgi:cysteine synthase A